MTSRRDASPTVTNKLSAPVTSDFKLVLVVFGTRPEAIKLCPLVTALREANPFLRVAVCVTGQHREMVRQVLDAFAIEPDFDLDVMTPGQTLNSLSSRLLAGLEEVLSKTSPALTIVQGDTTTTLCGALASFHRRIPVGHVEAGLRTYDWDSPFPEEGNRVLTDRLTRLHFAATSWSADNLLKEGFPAEGITVTGNTGIDAVLAISRLLDKGLLRPREFPLDSSKRVILVTAHRRESFGPVFDEICCAIAALAERDDVQIIWPVHPNPQVRMSVDRVMHGKENVLLTEPVDYVSFVHLMRSCRFILSDSGGIQEEATALGKPVLVLREKTERPEALQSGTVKLAGTSRETILKEGRSLLDNPEEYARMAQRSNEYGDGNACLRIAGHVVDFLFARLTN